MYLIATGNTYNSDMNAGESLAEPMSPPSGIPNRAASDAESLHLEKI